jgi:hypothetical protein
LNVPAAVGALGEEAIGTGIIGKNPPRVQQRSRCSEV